jgi:hypothetical protein
MAWLKSLLYTWYKVFGISSPEDIAAERASRNQSHELFAEDAAAETNPHKVN